MKYLLTSFIFVFGFFIIVSFKQKSNNKNQVDKDYSLARLSKINNKYVFLWSEPINDYDIAFTFNNQIVNYNCLSPEQICIASIDNANIESANQGRFYDAIVTVNSSARDMAIVWKDKSKDNSIARVQKQEGKLIFVQCEPLASYDISSKHNISGVGQQILLGTCPTQQQKIDKLLKKSSKENISFDAVMYGSSKYDLAIKFR